MSHSEIANIFQTTLYHYFEKLSINHAKAKALTVVAVSTNFMEYEANVVSDYFNALLAFLEEMEEAYSEIERCMLKPFRAELAAL